MCVVLLVSVWLGVLKRITEDTLFARCYVHHYCIYSKVETPCLVNWIRIVIQGLFSGWLGIMLLLGIA